MRLKCRPPVFLENIPVSTLPAQTQILNSPPSEPGIYRKFTGAIILMLEGHFTKTFSSNLVLCAFCLFYYSLPSAFQPCDPRPSPKSDPSKLIPSSNPFLGHSPGRLSEHTELAEGPGFCPLYQQNPDQPAITYLCKDLPYPNFTLTQTQDLFSLTHPEFSSRVFPVPWIAYSACDQDLSR